LWAAASAARSYRQKRQAELAAYSKAMPIYNEAMARWKRSYFCHRCGNIFELQTS
jgi:hypothetical protein